MTEIIYAFLNENYRVITCAIVMKDDEVTIERIKTDCNASFALPVNTTKELFHKDKMYWNGEKWQYDSPYPSWLWSDELYTWVAPVPYPEEKPKEDYDWVWNESELQWEEKEIKFL